MKQHLPVWTHAWLDVAIPLGQVLLIVLCAWLLRTVARRLIDRLTLRYDLPIEVTVSARRLSAFVLYFGALLLILERLGVSGAVLWTAFTGFAAVAAVAFFAAWSVLSNIFCAILLLITRPFRLHDHIELLDGGDGAARGLGGRVVDMNLICVTLQETREDAPDAYLRVPNSLFFQRVTRRWNAAPPPLPARPAGEAAPRARGARNAVQGGGGSLF